MERRIAIGCIAGAMGLVLFVALASFAQQDITRVEDSAFKSRMRATVSFAHDQHNEKAKIEECHICHHVYDHGKKVETSSSEGTKCSECHEIKDNDTMPLVIAYHNLCKKCHMEKKAGPVMCAECHQQEPRS